MNMLVNGEWRTDAYQTTNDDGEFERQKTTFRKRVTADGQTEFPVESGRYHLYICRACPWAHRTAIARQLLDLEDHISLSLGEPERYDDGWEFSPDYPDPLHDETYLRDLYTRADESFTGRVTVPVLWDKETDTIVNNESSDILRMMTTEFSDLANDRELYPEEKQDDIESIIEQIYEPINNGVYRAGFADSQKAYNTAVTELFDALDYWDSHLSDTRFLVGDSITEADICLFVTLVRFDQVYHTHFKCNQKALTDYDNLWPYTRDIYQTDGVRQTVNMGHIKRHYYKSHGNVNPKRLVATGPNIDFEQEHDRQSL